jgi:Mg2+ and Co2+ transporter CorA
MDMITENTEYLVEKIKNALMSNPNMDIVVSRAMAKFVQNLYDLDVSSTKMIETQKSVIESLKKRNNDQANIIAMEKAKNGSY